MEANSSGVKIVPFNNPNSNYLSYDYSSIIKISTYNHFIRYQLIKLNQANLLGENAQKMPMTNPLYSIDASNSDLINGFNESDWLKLRAVHEYLKTGRKNNRIGWGLIGLGFATIIASDNLSNSPSSFYTFATAGILTTATGYLTLSFNPFFSRKPAFNTLKSTEFIIDYKNKN